MTALPQDVVTDLRRRVAELEQRLQSGLTERDALTISCPGRGIALISAFTRVFDALWGSAPRGLDTKSRKQPHAK